jgi:hypothetical protein
MDRGAGNRLRTRTSFVPETNGKWWNGMRTGDIARVENAEENFTIANPPYSAC